MVEHLDIDQRQGPLQRARENLVGMAWLRDARRMVVREDRRRRVAAQRAFHNLPRIDARLRERSAEQLLDLENAVLGIQPHRYKHLMLPGGEPKSQVVAYRARAGHREAVASQLFFQDFECAAYGTLIRQSSLV